MLCLSMHVHADVFVCKNDKGGTVYQDTPCNNGVARKLDLLPAPSQEEQEAAQQRLQRINEQSQKFALAAESERQQQERFNLEQERLELERRRIELLEQQTLAEQNANQWVWVNPYYRSAYRNHWPRSQWHRDAWRDGGHNIGHEQHHLDKPVSTREMHGSGLKLSIQ